ncbi:NADH dehydrogenase subunit 6 (mitochondrion) [Strongylocentrotus purpuratus]|uniref:NADH-ubiquinone oxidoreductase chain 6 n=1 Tax=Strongylocentrotus purpuratus TaxID=7668 RepID=NU6M_STRPU|nr:NADH dehydrogenase subunit 6 [Strongylocentrotus purpuratus]P15553.1 RecName: Full=NADH-ubiquinone oxidoreductase chain 6; AltName: Full=NADH dehydrogenase subunit 6 [Strongylocentrotus purpuratus]CAA31161.1 NADH dehydrogenase (ND6) subunit 6 [Strongylocentrotus purpuratus]|eukprot:NP_006976.1 NADH dehydrogenase subunit 6 (mitochondrion) [Strongylocentrotus purpuratus]
MVVYVTLIVMLFGSTLVFYSLSPYYSALGLVVFSVPGSFVLSFLGSSFVPIVLFLVYIGGMLVVFPYSSAISPERFPSVNNLGEVVGLVFLFSSWVFMSFDNFQDLKNIFHCFVSGESLVGSNTFYNSGGVLVILGVFVLLVALVGALIISRGIESTIIRAIWLW